MRPGWELLRIGCDPGYRGSQRTSETAGQREPRAPHTIDRLGEVGEGLAFTPIPGVDLDEILCVEEEQRQVGNDNCVSYRTLKLQIPESPMRPHFVKARVKVHVYPDGSHALFHGPRCIGRYDENGRLKTTDDTLFAPLKSARRRNAVDGMDKPPACPPRPQQNKAEEADI